MLSSKIQSQSKVKANAKQRTIMITSEYDMVGWCENLTDWHIKAVDYFAVGKEEKDINLSV